MKRFCSWCAVDVEEGKWVTAKLTGAGTGKMRGQVVFCSEECLALARRKLPCFENMKHKEGSLD